MRLSLKYSLAVFVAVLSLAACNKSGSDEGCSGTGKFSYKGQEYATLQEALDAVAATPLESETENIILTGDRREGGAAVAPDYVGHIGIDLGKYTYAVNLGELVDFGNASVDLNADGGAFEGDVVLNAEDGERMLVILPSFRGNFTGNVRLGSARLNILSEDARVNIPRLVVEDNLSGLDIACTPKQKVHIDKALSASPFPVCAYDDGVAEIVAGGRLHVHSFTEVSRAPSTCISPGYIVWKCECGFEKYESENEGAGPCPQDELVHMKYDGTEFWTCRLCGSRYSDPEGKTPYYGLSGLLSSSFLLDYNVLHSVDDKLSWKTDPQLGIGPIEITGLVLAIIGLVETALMTFVPGWTSDEDEQWQEVNAKLDQIKSSLAQIEKKIDEIADKIDAVSYKQLAMERNGKFNFLRTKSVAAYQLISGYFEDESLSEEERNAKILSVIKDWSASVYGGTAVSDLVQSLMQQYTGTGLGVTVPEAFEAIANLTYLWEHEGYNFRCQVLAEDVMLSSISCEMALLYLSSVKEYNNEDLRKIDLENLRNDYTAYSDAVKAELERIQTRDALYRRYNRDKITFSRTAVRVNFHSWFENHRSKGFPRENQDNKASNSCNQILRDLGLEGRLEFTSSIAQTLYSYYNRNNGSNPVGIYKILKDSVGFQGIPVNFDPGIIFTWNNSGFSHLNDNDVAYPVYKIFSWESHRGSSNNDFFGIRTCLNNKCGTENHNILYKCDISSYSDGLIEEMGESTRWDWYTFVTAE